MSKRPYNSYSYIYPPRPEAKINPSKLDKYEKMGMFIAEPKINGACCLVFTNGDKFIVKNRTKDNLSWFKIKDQLKPVFDKICKNGKWNVFVGEYLCKGQKDHKGKKWNDALILFDILVYNGFSLTDMNYIERHTLISTLFEYTKNAKPYLNKITDDLWFVGYAKKNFKQIYDYIIKYDLYEGLVLKKINAKLEYGSQQKNNTKTQLKCRKPTKNYSY
jgi:ATP-dependent DNA ligase